ncbi:TetR/AcrR family transcriptional regulator [Streptomyces caeni]|uniref:TetR/AcrR family transcriptional regulator n=1 Tax=Streptomyces caeni TaxID=2307231 RepID=A0ABW4IWG3_9ACTN
MRPTRRRLLDAAEKLVRTTGLSGATTKALAREANCSEAMLYKHFESKDALLVCLLRERLPALLSAAYGDPAHDVADVQGTEQSCRHLVHRTMRFYETALPLLCPLLADPALLAAYSADPLRRSNGTPEEPLTAVISALERWRAAGRIRSDADLETAATSLVGACFQRFFLRHCGFGEETRDQEEFAAALARALARSLA